MKHFLAYLLVLLLVAAQGATAQSMVTVDRNRLQKERAQRAKQKTKPKHATKAAPRKSRTKHVATRRRTQPVQREMPVERYFYVNGRTYSDVAIAHWGIIHGYSISTNDRGYCAVTHLPSWAKVYTQSESQISIEYAANPTHRPRTDYLEFSLNGRSARINVAQEGKPVIMKAELSYINLWHNVPSSKYNSPVLQISGNVEITGGMDEPCCVVALFSEYYDHGWIKAQYNYTNCANMDGNLMVRAEFTPNTDDPTRFSFTLDVPNQAFGVWDKKKFLYCHLYVYRLNTNEFVCEKIVHVMVKNRRGKIKTKDW